MNDYGVRPATLFGLAIEPGVIPNTNDVYSPLNVPFRGNTHAAAVLNGWTPTTRKERVDFMNSDAGKGANLEILDWNTNKMIDFDIRLFYFWQSADAWSKCRWTPDDSSVPTFYWKQQLRQTQICYSADALKYAQTGYLVTIVNMQHACMLVTKARKLSLSQQGMKNNHGNFGLFFETALIAIIVYIPWIG